MQSAVPQKIVLKSTTKLSLNERFGNIHKARLQTGPQEVRMQMAGALQASAKNKRLALQMARRGQGNIQQQQPAQQLAANKLKKKSLKQRLGVQARIGNPKGSIASRLGGVRGGRGRGTVGRGLGKTLRGRGGALGKVTSYRGARGMSRGARSGRGTRGQLRGGRGGQTQGGQSRGGFNQRGRGSARGRGGRGRGGRGRSQNKPVSKDTLDNDLDAYMAKTKSSLDSELDAYMAGTD